MSVKTEIPTQNRTEVQAMAALLIQSRRRRKVSLDDAREATKSMDRAEVIEIVARRLHASATGALRREAQARETAATQPRTTNQSGGGPLPDGKVGRADSGEVTTRTVLTVLGPGETLPLEVLNEAAPHWRGLGIRAGTFWGDLTREQLQRIRDQYQKILGAYQAGLARAEVGLNCFNRMPQAQTLREACAGLES